MSRNNIKKPFCKVCQDAGKPESEYSSHWVKDLTGKTTCPTLLNTECRFCYKLGHTSKFCKKKSTTHKPTTQSQPQSKPQTQPQKKLSAFAALDDDDSEDEEVEVAVPTIQKNDWASVAAKPKHMEPVIQSTGFVTLSRNTKQTSNPEPKPVPMQKLELKPEPKPVPMQMKSWADLSDEEDYDEEYEEEEEDDTW